MQSFPEMLLLPSSLHSWQLSFRGRVTIIGIALWLSFACIPGSVPGLVSGFVSGFMMEPDDLYWPRLWLHHEARTHSTGSMMEPVAIGWIWSIVIGVAKYHMAVLKRWTIAPPQKKLQSSYEKMCRPMSPLCRLNTRPFRCYNVRCKRRIKVVHSKPPLGPL